MDKPLAGKTVAILVANGFEEVQMTEPQRALIAAGAQFKVVSPEQGLVNGWHGQAWGHYFAVDGQLSSALAADFDALLVPGGERSIAKLAQNPHTRRILKGFVDAGKPVIMVGHAPMLLIGAERAKGFTVSAADAVSGELAEAGAVVSTEVESLDGALLTLRDEVEGDALKSAVVRHLTVSAEAMADAA